MTDLATHAESVASVKVPGAAERNALEGPDALSGCRDAKTSPCRPPADCLTRPNPEPPQNDDTKIFLNKSGKSKFYYSISWRTGRVECTPVVFFHACLHGSDFILLREHPQPYPSPTPHSQNPLLTRLCGQVLDPHSQHPIQRESRFSCGGLRKSTVALKNLRR